MWIGFYAVFLLLVATTETWGQVSIGTLRASAENSNLESVTLQGIVHLTRPSQHELGGRCGSAAFTLEDNTGSVEVSIRRVQRLIEPLREGDRVQVNAQVEVFRSRDNIPIRVCVEAREIQHLGK
jgi:DNA/RNA endonuclease YhcR with UshA esterase domain